MAGTMSGGMSARVTASRSTDADSSPSRSSGSTWPIAASPSTGRCTSAHSSPARAGRNRVTPDTAIAGASVFRCAAALLDLVAHHRVGDPRP